MMQKNVRERKKREWKSQKETIVGADSDGEVTGLENVPSTLPHPGLVTRIKEAACISIESERSLLSYAFTQELYNSPVFSGKTDF